MTARQATWKWIGWILAVSLAAVLVGWHWEYLDWRHLAEHEAELREWSDRNRVWALLVASLLYIAVAAFSIPGATALSLATAWFFGFWSGLIVVSFASTAGATLAFGFARFFLRQSLGPRLDHWQRVSGLSLAGNAAQMLLVLRLIPMVPFFVVNLLMASTPIRWRTFWWISQVGMLPATIVYVFAGSSLPDLSVLVERGLAGVVNERLLAALALLGLFAATSFWLVRRFSRNRRKVLPE